MVNEKKRQVLKREKRDFPGSPVIKMASTAGGVGSVPGLGTKISHATPGGRKKKGERDRTTVIKDQDNETEE